MDDFITQLLKDQDNEIVVKNDEERDGYPSTRLFTIDQAAISIKGGTTVTQDKSENIIAPAVQLFTTQQGQQQLVLVAIAAALGWFLSKQSK